MQRRRWLVRVVLFAGMVGVGLLLASPWSARAETSVPVGNQLTGVLQRLGGVSELGPLGEPLPLIGGTPAQPRGMLGIPEEEGTR